jgi:hypothetical protein
MLSKHRDTKKQTDTKQVAASPPRPNLPSEKEITRPDRTARELSLRNKTIQDQTFNVHNTNTHLMYKSLVDLVAKDIEAVKTQGKISKTLSFEDQLNGNKTLDNRVLYTSFNTSFDTFLNAQTLEHHDIHHINRSFIESFYQFKGKSSVTEKSEGTLFELSMQVARKSNTLSQFIHQTHHSEMNRTFNQVLSRTLKTLKSLHIETSTDSFTPQESVLSKQKSGPTTLKRDTNSPDTHLRPQYLKNKVDTSHAELDHERTQASTPEARQMQVLRQFKKISKEMSMTGRKHTKTQFSHTLFNTYDPSQVQNEQVNRTITRFNNISQLTQTALSEIENKNIRPVQKDYASQAQMLARKMDEKPRERPMESIEINPEPFVEKTAIESMSASTIQPVQEAMDGVDVDAIFEKIYQKFEKRISFEKRRRGL